MVAIVEGFFDSWGEGAPPPIAACEPRRSPELGDFTFPLTRSCSRHGGS